MSTRIFPSLVGSILGVNRYKSRMHTIHRYTSKRESTALSKVTASNWNNRQHEANARDVLELEMGVSCYLASKLTLESNMGWLLCGQCDGITSDGHLVEIKTRIRHIHQTISWNDYAQVQSYLALYDMNRCYFIQKIANSNESKVQIVKRDQAYWNSYVVPELTRFSQVVLDMRHEQSHTTELYQPEQYYQK